MKLILYAGRRVLRVGVTDEAILEHARVLGMIDHHLENPRRLDLQLRPTAAGDRLPLRPAGVHVHVPK